MPRPDRGTRRVDGRSWPGSVRGLDAGFSGCVLSRSGSRVLWRGELIGESEAEAGMSRMIVLDGEGSVITLRAAG